MEKKEKATLEYIVNSICNPVNVKYSKNYIEILYQIKENILKQDPTGYEDVLKLYNKIIHGINLNLLYVEAKNLYKHLNTITYHAVAGNRGVAIGTYKELLQKILSTGIIPNRNNSIELNVYGNEKTKVYTKGEAA